MATPHIARAQRHCYPLPNSPQAAANEGLEEKTSLNGVWCHRLSHACHIDNWVLGLFKNHQLWKLKAGPVVSHGFRHAEFNGAQKNRFQALIGVANLINLFFENALEVKASKCENHIKSVPKICKMMRGLQIWPQNWNRIRFDPFSGQKSCQNGLNWVFCQFPTVFGQKNGSNLNWFEFWGQIWNPLIVLHILGTHLIWFSHFDFLTSHVFSKI